MYVCMYVMNMIESLSKKKKERKKGIEKGAVEKVQESPLRVSRGKNKDDRLEPPRGGDRLEIIEAL